MIIQNAVREIEKFWRELVAFADCHSATFSRIAIFNGCFARAGDPCWRLPAMFGLNGRPAAAERSCEPRWNTTHRQVTSARQSPPFLESGLKHIWIRRCVDSGKEWKREKSREHDRTDCTAESTK